MIGKRKRSIKIDLDKIKKYHANIKFKEMFSVHKIDRATYKYNCSQSAYGSEDYDRLEDH